MEEECCLENKQLTAASSSSLSEGRGSAILKFTGVSCPATTSPVRLILICCVSLNIGIALSRWCISHQKKVRQIVERWDKLFNSSSQKEQRVSFLYLANDILQNSRRKGSEFVNEFWKVLPASLKYVYENGEDHGKKAVMRLVRC